MKIPNVFEKKRLSEILGLSPSYISHAIKRGNITQTSDGYIDIDSAKNSQWLKRICDKKGIEFEKLFEMPVPPRRAIKKNGLTPEPEPAPVPKIKIRKKNNEEFEISDLSGLTGDVRAIAEQKILADIEYKHSQIRLNQIKEDKYRGDLMPTDAVIGLFNFAFETVRATYLQEVRSIAEIYRQKMEISHIDFIEIQKDLTIAVNSISKIFKSELANGVDTIINEYKEVRGRGEVK